MSINLALFLIGIKKISDFFGWPLKKKINYINVVNASNDDLALENVENGNCTRSPTQNSSHVLHFIFV